MSALIVATILMIISVAVSIYMVANPSEQAPDAISYEYWWMSLPI